MAGKPFDAKTARAWSFQNDVDPSSLFAGQQRVLRRARLEAQLELLRRGIQRHDIITVNTQGAICKGHHGTRAAVLMGCSIEVMIVDYDTEPGEPIAALPILE